MLPNTRAGGVWFQRGVHEDHELFHHGQHANDGKLRG